MGLWQRRDAAADPKRSDDARAAMIRGPRAAQRDAGSGVKTGEHRGVRDHVR